MVDATDKVADFLLLFADQITSEGECVVRELADIEAFFLVDGVGFLSDALARESAECIGGYIVCAFKIEMRSIPYSSIIALHLIIRWDVIFG